jgi:hypothetical protein
MEVRVFLWAEENKRKHCSRSCSETEASEQLYFFAIAENWNFGNNHYYGS